MRSNRTSNVQDVSRFAESIVLEVVMIRKFILSVSVAVVLLFISAGVLLGPMVQRFGLYEGSYYTRVDNERIASSDSNDDLDYEYSLYAYARDGSRIEVRFGTSRILRDGAYLQLELLPLRGVVSWSEVDLQTVPASAAKCLR